MHATLNARWHANRALRLKFSNYWYLRAVNGNRRRAQRAALCRLASAPRMVAGTLTNRSEPRLIPSRAIMAEPNSEHPNVARYRRMMAAFNANDLGTISELIASDVDYVVPGRSLIAGHTRDLGGLLDTLRRSKDLSGGTLKLELRSVVADEQYLFAYGRVTAQRGSKALDSDHCVVFRFANGKIVGGRTVPVDLYEFDDFWT